jgi:hypothetical protein
VKRPKEGPYCLVCLLQRDLPVLEERVPCKNIRAAVAVSQFATKKNSGIKWVKAISELLARRFKEKYNTAVPVETPCISESLGCIETRCHIIQGQRKIVTTHRFSRRRWTLVDL